MSKKRRGARKAGDWGNSQPDPAAAAAVPIAPAGDDLPAAAPTSETSGAPDEPIAWPAFLDPLDSLMSGGGQEHSELLEGAAEVEEAGGHVLDAPIPTYPEPESAPTLVVSKPAPSPPPAAPNPFAKLLAKAEAVAPEPVPAAAPAAPRKPRGFPSLPPDATTLPPPLPPLPPQEELPMGAPRGLEDLPAAISAAMVAQSKPPELERVDPALIAARERAQHFSLWDAADTGEAFPTFKQAMQALAWSVLTGVLGFGVSYYLFVKNEVISNVPRIDRQAAEAAPPLAYRSNSDGVNYSFAGYSGGSLADSKDAKGPLLALKVPKVDDLPKAPVAINTPTPTPTPVSNSDNDQYYPGGGKREHVAIHRPNVVVTPTPEPGVAARPAPKGWIQAWADSKDSVVRFFNADGAVSGGVIVTKEGLVLTCLSRLSPESLSRTMTSKGIVTGTILAKDPENDIALVQLPAGEYPFVPLCPESPHSGDWLMSPNAQEPTRQCQQQCCGSLSGNAFRVRGAVLSGSMGLPFINDRGECVGIALGRPWLFAGNQQAATSASALVKFVQAGGKAPGSMSGRTGNELLLDFLGSAVPSIPGDARPTGSNAKVTAGDSMGNYQLGLTRAQLLAAVGQPSKKDDQDGIDRLEFSTQRITCYLAKDRVVAIETDFPFYTAGRGLSVGSPADSSRFLAEYSGAIWFDQGSLTLGIAPGLEIEAQGGKFSKIRVVPK